MNRFAEIKKRYDHLGAAGLYITDTIWLVNEVDRLTAALAEKDKEIEKVKENAVELVSDMAEEYNQTTNRLIERHAEQLSIVRQSGIAEGRKSMREEIAEDTRKYLMDMGYPLRANDVFDRIRTIPLTKETPLDEQDTP